MTAFILTACEAGTQASQTQKTVETPAETATDRATPLRILEVLSGNDMGGRQTGTEGNAKARAYLLGELKAREVWPLRGDYLHEFSFENRDGEMMEGINLVGIIPGKAEGSGKVLVVTAHYDHIGTRNGEVFHGADDNASGVAGAFAVIDHFQAEPPEHDVVIALLDAEEMGLQGARAFLKDQIVETGLIGLNINFDMLSKNDKNELYAAGAWHRRVLEPLLNAVAAEAPVGLKLGHDDPALGQDDWTLQSDHGPFHQAGIPFVYFGVEDHVDYHRPTDTFDRVPQDFFLRSIETVVMAAEKFDAELGTIAAAE
jgi:Zn-dependent M28 family amino/carboxypeptidase